MSIDISHIFRSKYCFFSIRIGGLFLGYAQSRINLRIARNFEFEKTIYTYKKASVMGKFTREILYKIVSKVLVLQC